MTAMLQAVAFPPTGDTLWASCNEHGKVYVAVRPICVVLGLTWHAQYERIKRSPVLSEGVRVMRTPSAGGEQKTVCLPLDLLPGWLFGVDANRVNEAARAKLIAYQRECFAALWAHFNGGAVKLADNDPMPPLSADNDDDGGDDGGVDDDAAESVADDLGDMPERALALKITMVREARLLSGRDAAKRLWRRLKLPELEEPDAHEPPVVVDALALFIGERLMAAQGLRTRSEDIWRAYLDWASRRGFDVVGRKTFGLALAKRYRPIKSGVMWYRDVALRPACDLPPLSA